MIFKAAIELDMQTCPYPPLSSKADAWREGVFSMWRQLKLILAPARAAIAEAYKKEKS